MGRCGDVGPARFLGRCPRNPTAGGENDPVAAPDPPPSSALPEAPTRAAALALPREPARCPSPAHRPLSLAGVGQSRQRLVRTGISLVVLGHLTLVLGAIVHGAVLRHVARPGRAITSEYAVANVVAVLSGLLSIATGVLAILLSRSGSPRALPWVMLFAALANSLVSGACCVGLLLAISLTVASSGRLLLLGCNSSALPRDARSVMTNECPFDTTRIYDTTLVLWLPSLVMAAMEAGLSAWCCMASLSLRGIRASAVPCQEALLPPPDLKQLQKAGPAFALEAAPCFKENRTGQGAQAGLLLPAVWGGPQLASAWPFLARPPGLGLSRAVLPHCPGPLCTREPFGV
ncbi:keratinocyte-associated protein 3 [Elgaria multicarinata webbii]|uniref:keratinocyte-associated protein 3 n=1 Tax=Elgaria multicarinata webbii TaxID=159646 RepID=UPI002FCCD7F8